MNDWNTGPDSNTPHDPWAAPQQDAQQNWQDAYDGRGHMLQSSNGTTVLVLGILSWIMCGFFTSLPGFIMARADREQIKRGVMAPDSSIEAGYWLCAIQLGFTVLLLSFYFVLFVVVVVGEAM